MPRATLLGAPLAVRRRAGAEAEVEPAAADPLHARRRGGEHRGMTIGDVGDERAEPDRGRRRREGAEQGEALQHRPIALNRGAVEVIEHPGGVVPVGLGAQDRVAKTGQSFVPGLY